MIIGGRVENATINGSITYSGDAIGGIAGNIKNGVIYNCTNNASISGDSSMKQAGIAGNCMNSTIQDCINSGTIRGKTLVGGIVGEAFDNSRIINCSNTKLITACGSRVQQFYENKAINTCHVGGIAGAVWNNSTVTNCSNKGDITTSSAFNLNNANICLGGIAGVLSNNSIVSTSNNKGRIIYKGNQGIIGGVVGYSVDGTISQCYNANEIKGNFITKQTASGGIVGWIDGCKVKNCYNISIVEAGFASGGIAGGSDSPQSRKSSYIYNCYCANASISGSDIVGTFMGSLENVGIVNCCFITDTKYTGEEKINIEWISWKFFTIDQMKTISSGILTTLNSGEGTENNQKLWAQDTKNEGLPYLRYNTP